MPVRNAESTIRSAIQSCLKGMAAEDELVIVNDASTDLTNQYLSTISDSRVVQLRNEENLGVAASLNLAIAASSKPLLARMDADDVMLPWRRHLSLKALESPKTDFVFTTAVVFGESIKVPLPQFPLGVRAKDCRGLLSRGNPFVHSTMLARRSTLENLGNYLNTPMEDYDLWIRAALAGYLFTQVSTPCLLYRQHRRQITRSDLWDQHKQPESLAELRKTQDYSEASSPNGIIQKVWNWNQR